MISVPGTVRKGAKESNMKLFLYGVLAFTIMCSSFAGTSLKIPLGAKSVSELEDVKKSAKEKNKAIVFICSDFESKCSDLKKDNKDYLEGLRNAGITVCVPVDGFNRVMPDAAEKLPQLVRETFAKSNKVPRVIICDPDLKEIIDCFGWVDQKGGKRAKRIKEAYDKIAAKKLSLYSF